MSFTVYQQMAEIQALEKIQLTTDEITLLKLRVRLTTSEIAELLGTNKMAVSRALKRANEKIKEQQG